MAKSQEPVDIIIQHIGSSPNMVSCTGGESTTGDASHARVILKLADGTQQVIYVGPEFSEAEYAKKQEVIRHYKGGKK